MTMNCLPIQWRRRLILSAAVAFAACSSSSTTNDAQVAGGSGGTTLAGSGGASAQLDAAVASTGGSADSGVGASTTSGGGSTGTSNTGVDAAQADRPATGGTGADAPIWDGQGDLQPDVSYLGDRDVGGDTGEGIDAGENDPYFSNVVLLMHFDGANGATSFTDVKGHAVTPHGSAALSSATSAFGGASGHFDGASGYLTLDYSDDWNFYAQDFTVELFVYFKGGVSGQLEIPTLFSFAANSWTDWGGWQVCYDVNWTAATANANNQVPGTVFFIFTTTGSDEVNPAAAWTPAANAWYHLAIVRHGSDFLYFVNGTLIGSQSLGSAGVADWPRVTPGSGPWLTDGGVSANASINVTNSAILGIGAGIASDAPINAQSYFNGNIDEVRITKGVARYIANFTTPTGPFPDK